MGGVRVDDDSRWLVHHDDSRVVVDDAEGDLIGRRGLHELALRALEEPEVGLEDVA